MNQPNTQAPADERQLKRYEPSVVIEESRGRLTATGAAMEAKEGGRWVRYEDVAAALASQPAQAERVSAKDHEIAQVVNKLRDIAVEFYGHQQLRERIARAVVPLLKAERPVPLTGVEREAIYQKVVATKWGFDTEAMLRRAITLTEERLVDGPTPTPVAVDEREPRCSICGATLHEPHHPQCSAVTAAVIGINNMAANNDPGRRMQLATKIKGTLIAALQSARSGQDGGLPTKPGSMFLIDLASAMSHAEAFSGGNIAVSVLDEIVKRHVKSQDGGDAGGEVLTDGQIDRHIENVLFAGGLGFKHAAPGTDEAMRNAMRAALAATPAATVQAGQVVGGDTKQI